MTAERTTTWMDEYGITLSVDEHGRVHKGEGDGGGQFTKKDGDTSGSRDKNSDVWNFSDSLPEHNSWRYLEADPNYFYHASNKDNAADIQGSSMKPHRPSHGTDQATWPDGSTAKRVYFSDTPSTAWQFAPDNSVPVLLRVKRHKSITRESGTQDFHLEGRGVPAHKVEILTSDGWKPLKDRPSKDKADTGTQFGTDSDWPTHVLGQCLFEAGGDVQAAMSAAGYILATQPARPTQSASNTHEQTSVPRPSSDIALSTGNQEPGDSGWAELPDLPCPLHEVRPPTEVKVTMSPIEFSVPVVHLTVDPPPPRTKRIEHDVDGNYTRIVEE